MELIDTHCHIHFEQFDDIRAQVLEDAKSVGVKKLIVVGCSLDDSEKAVNFAETHDNIWATVGAHPHDGADFSHDPNGVNRLKQLAKRSKVVAIGEIGLDYFHSKASKDDQKRALRDQLKLATEVKLPVVFHIRDAWDDFWPIFDEFSSITGVIHSFTGHKKELDESIKRGLYLGINGIATFTRDERQLEAFKAVPSSRLLLETDAPFLTPKPFRGSICKPEHVVITAEFLAGLRGETLEAVAKSSATNALELFQLK